MTQLHHDRRTTVLICNNTPFTRPDDHAATAPLPPSHPPHWLPLAAATSGSRS